MSLSFKKRLHSHLWTAHTALQWSMEDLVFSDEMNQEASISWSLWLEKLTVNIMNVKVLRSSIVGTPTLYWTWTCLSLAVLLLCSGSGPQVSTLIPDHFQEWLVQVYCKRTDETSLKTASDHFKDWRDAQVIIYCLQFITPCGSIFSN